MCTRFFGLMVLAGILTACGMPIVSPDVAPDSGAEEDVQATEASVDEDAQVQPDAGPADAHEAATDAIVVADAPDAQAPDAEADSGVVADTGPVDSGPEAAPDAGPPTDAHDPRCPTDWEYCSTTMPAGCVPPGTFSGNDPNNCGRCGVECHGISMCLSGTCQCISDADCPRGTGCTSGFCL